VMGHRPPAVDKPAPTRESFHLMTAKTAYVVGNLTLDEFEASVWHVLKGGTLDRTGRIRTEAHAAPLRLHEVDNPYLTVQFPKPQMQRVLK
jgi:hypothetical protein